MKIKIFSDGGARGNPGPAGCGFVIYDEDSLVIKSDSIFIGRSTNNQAEYKALIFALEYVNDELQKIEKLEAIECFLDSELVVKQLNKEYKVKNPDMISLFNEVRNLVLETGGIATFAHVRREFNKEADALANAAMDKAEYLQS
jgi:ribonuclease HI